MYNHAEIQRPVHGQLTRRLPSVCKAYNIRFTKLEMGILVGPTYNIGDGGSLAFDGNDYVSTPLISGTSFTWSVWFKTNTIWLQFGSKC